MGSKRPCRSSGNLNNIGYTQDICHENRCNCGAHYDQSKLFYEIYVDPPFRYSNILKYLQTSIMSKYIDKVIYTIDFSLKFRHEHLLEFLQKNTKFHDQST